MSDHENHILNPAKAGPQEQPNVAANDNPVQDAAESASDSFGSNGDNGSQASDHSGDAAPAVADHDPAPAPAADGEVQIPVQEDPDPDQAPEKACSWFSQLFGNSGEKSENGKIPILWIILGIMGIVLLGGVCCYYSRGNQETILPESGGRTRLSDAADDQMNDQQSQQVLEDDNDIAGGEGGGADDNDAENHEGSGTPSGSDLGIDPSPVGSPARQVPEIFNLSKDDDFQPGERLRQRSSGRVVIFQEYQPMWEKHDNGVMEYVRGNLCLVKDSWKTTSNGKWVSIGDLERLDIRPPEVKENVIYAPSPPGSPAASEDSLSNPPSLDSELGPDTFARGEILRHIISGKLGKFQNYPYAETDRGRTWSFVLYKDGTSALRPTAEFERAPSEDW